MVVHTSLQLRFRSIKPKVTISLDMVIIVSIWSLSQLIGFSFQLRHLKVRLGYVTLGLVSFNNSNDQRLILVHETMCVCVSKMTVNVDV